MQQQGVNPHYEEVAREEAAGAAGAAGAVGGSSGGSSGRGGGGGGEGRVHVRVSACGVLLGESRFQAGNFK